MTESARMLSEIQSLIIAIGKKHGTYCNFTIVSGHNPDGTANYGHSVDYKTYIADDVMCSTHAKHTTLLGARTRLKKFLDIDDLSTHNKDIARQKLAEYREQYEYINSEMRRLADVIGDDNLNQED